MTAGAGLLTAGFALAATGTLPGVLIAGPGHRSSDLDAEFRQRGRMPVRRQRIGAGRRVHAQRDPCQHRLGRGQRRHGPVHRATARQHGRPAQRFSRRDQPDEPGHAGVGGRLLQPGRRHRYPEPSGIHLRLGGRWRYHVHHEFDSTLGIPEPILVAEPVLIAEPSSSRRRARHLDHQAPHRLRARHHHRAPRQHQPTRPSPTAPPTSSALPSGAPATGVGGAVSSRQPQ